MAITVSKLYSNSGSLYEMKLIAGKEGLHNLVDWVYLVEDKEVSNFLRGHELILCAGYLIKDTDWLLDFVKQLHVMETSAFVINIGPYVKSVPREIIDFCDEVNMPLFTIPWKTRMVDMTRDYCTRIIRNENVESTIISTMKDIIFKVGDLETQIQQMKRFGFRRDSSFCFVSITIQSEQKYLENEHMEQVKQYVERIVRRSQRLFISFSYQTGLIVVYADELMETIHGFVEELLRLTQPDKKDFILHMGVSSVVQGFVNLDANFEKAVTANEMAKKRNLSVNYYDDLDVYKVLLSVKDKKILFEYYDEVLGKLEQYDRENETDLMGFLKVYLENDGKPQVVAEKQFVHRNTVNNQIKKIEKITGYNLLNLNEKVRCSIGYLIKDIL
jgi:hypothetical protein